MQMRKDISSNLSDHDRVLSQTETSCKECEKKEVNFMHTHTVERIATSLYVCMYVVCRQRKWGSGLPSGDYRGEMPSRGRKSWLLTDLVTQSFLCGNGTPFSTPIHSTPLHSAFVSSSLPSLFSLFVP